MIDKWVTINVKNINIVALFTCIFISNIIEIMQLDFQIKLNKYIIELVSFKF